MTGSAVLLSKCGVGLDRGAMTARKRKAVDQYSTVTEADFQRQVVAAARMLGWECYHTFDSRHSEAGFPDCVLVKPPRILFAEIKSEQGQLSSAQMRWLNTLRECPGTAVYLWRPSDMDAAIRVLEGA